MFEPTETWKAEQFCQCSIVRALSTDSESKEFVDSMIGSPDSDIRKEEGFCHRSMFNVVNLRVSHNFAINQHQWFPLLSLSVNRPFPYFLSFLSVSIMDFIVSPPYWYTCTLCSIIDQKFVSMQSACNWVALFFFDILSKRFEIRVAFLAKNDGL